ncbi:MAG TPA: aspartyl-phosphate phosphatase Spo0E family protein [Halanaerobiales bacterium]|nr:aspartyl-phosphate phosphatase Spo0E family protein [Halanaerobiales bacterium]
MSPLKTKVSTGIEKLREELKSLGKKNELTEKQVLKKSRELDQMLNIYYKLETIIAKKSG